MGVNSCGTTLIDNGLFNNIGAITWDTTAKTSGFTAVSGNGYFVNTTSGAITVTLPSSPSASAVVGIADYANTADTNNITINRNGSNIQGAAADFKISKEGLSIILVYVDATQGWLSVDAGEASNIVAPQYVAATGGSIATVGDYKIHTFTGPGTFCVSNAGNEAGCSSVDYMVVAGGGGGSATSNGSGGAGAGGFRESVPSPAAWTASPLANPGGALPVSVQGYPITVGGGGAGHVGDPENSGNGTPGSNSVFSSTTSAGGGGGGSAAGLAGGSGGGSGQGQAGGGAGNTPPVSPPQGNSGAASVPEERGAGGGGAGAAGSSVTGGNGVTSSINNSAVARAGGGGGGARCFPAVPSPAGSGGSGGGGAGAKGNNGGAGTVNTGGGGGGAGRKPGVGNFTGGAGGSGIVIIRYKFQ
jgi:hypothetical protein